MKPMKRIEATDIIEQSGFYLKSNNGHIKYQCPTTGLCIVLSNDNRVSAGVMRHINKQIRKAKELRDNTDKSI